jgi:hypothetical protein
MRPFPVMGEVKAVRTRSRTLSWEKIDSFKDIRSMRVIILKRNFWHMMHLYTPDTACHATVAHYLSERLDRKHCEITAERNNYNKMI